MMSRKKQCTPVPSIGQNGYTAIHYRPKFIKQLATLLSFGFFWLSFASATSPHYVIPHKTKSAEHFLQHCDSAFQFTSDTLSHNYVDTKPRTSTITFCPRSIRQRVGVQFQDFDLAVGDTLYAYDGRSATAPLLGKASGQGVFEAFGGGAHVSYDRRKNPTSCITFVLRTNGDRLAATGWQAEVRCTDRLFDIQVPDIPNQQVTCELGYVNIDILAAELISQCGPLNNDSTMVQIIEGTTGVVCGETCLSYEAGMFLTHPFSVGTYKIVHTSLLDPSISDFVLFTVAAPPLICKDQITISLDNSREAIRFPEMILTDYCPPIPNILHYNILIKDMDGVIVEHGSSLEGEYPDLSAANIDFCKNSDYVVEIQQVYTANPSVFTCITEKAFQFCTSTIKVVDEQGPVFTDPVIVDTLITCALDLTSIVLGLTPPSTALTTGVINVKLLDVVAIDSPSNCAVQSNYQVTWMAADACRNETIRKDTLVVLPPTPVFELAAQIDTIYACQFDLTNMISTLTTPSTVTRPYILNDCSTTTVELEGVTPIASSSDCTTESDYLINWVATNACGQETKRQDKLIVLAAPPVFFVPSTKPDTVYACDFDLTEMISTLVTPSIVNNCSTTGVVLTSVDPIANNSNCANQSDYLVNWVATNACGQETKRQDKVVVVSPSPVFVQAPKIDTLFACDFNLNEMLSTLITPSVVNNCSTVEVELVDVTSIPSTSNCTSQPDYLIDWVATNACGQQTKRQDKLIVLATAPIFFVPNTRPDTVYACDFDLTEMISTLVTPSIVNNCSTTEVVLTSVDPIASNTNCANQPDYLVNWVATNDCGQETKRQDKVVVLAPNPVFVQAPKVDTLFACDFDLNEMISTLVTPSIVNNCSTTDVQLEDVTPIISSTNCTTQSDYLINWIATNACGQISKRQDKLVLVAPAPIFVQTFKIDTLFACDFDLDEMISTLVTPSIVNNCSTTEVQLGDVTPIISSTNCTTQSDYLINWIATNACGQITKRQDKLILNSPSPIFVQTSKTDTIYACNFDLNEMISTLVTPSIVSNCSTIEVELEGINPIASTSNCTTQPDYLINWIATNACGQQTKRQDKLIVLATAPIFLVPNPRPDTIFACDFDLTEMISTLVTPSVVNNCSIIEVKLFSVDPIASASNCANQPDYLVSWIATNDCGQETTRQDKVVVLAPNPVFAQAPKIDTLFACNFDLNSIIPNLITPSIVNNCSSTDVQLGDVTPIISSTNCTTQSDYLINWIATNTCGQISKRQDKLVLVAPSPIFVQTPKIDTLFACDFDLTQMISTLTTPSIVNNCSSTDVQLGDVTPIISSTNCTTQPDYLINWIATNACGQITKRQDKLVLIAPSPIFIQAPKIDTIFACNFDLTQMISTLTTPSIVNNCSSTDVQLEGVNPIASASNCSMQPDYLINWVATNTCGQQVKRQDRLIILSTPPAFVATTKIDTIFACDFDLNQMTSTLITPSVINNCSTTDVQLESVTPIGSSTNCAMQSDYLVNWIATNTCGQQARRQDKVVVLSANPVFFVPATRPDTLFACNFNLNEMISTLTTPSTVLNCSTTEVTLEGVVPVENTSNCAMQPDYLINWVATNACGLQTKRQDTLRVLIPRPLFLQAPQVDTLFACEIDSSTIIANLAFPLTANICGTTVVQLETVLPINGDAGCSGNIDYLVSWIATNHCGQQTRRKDKIVVLAPRPTFEDLFQVDTLLACDFNINTIGTNLQTPALTNSCSATTVRIEEIMPVAGSVCILQSDYQITWLAVNSCGQQTRRQDKVVLSAPLPEFVETAQTDTMFACEFDINVVAADLTLPVTKNACGEGEVQLENILPISNNPDCPIQKDYLLTWVIRNSCGQEQRRQDRLSVLPLKPVFLEPAQTDTVFACTFDLPSMLSTLVVPSTLGVCSSTSVQLGDVTPITGASNCNNHPSYTIDWIAADVCGNEITRQDTLRVLPPSPIFEFPARTDTIFACNFDLSTMIASLVLPTTTNACDATIPNIQLEEVNPIGETSTCTMQPDFLLTWVATNSCGSSTRRQDTLKILRPSIEQITNIVDVSVACETGIDIDDIPVSEFPSLQIGIQVNGDFLQTETVRLIPNQSTCNYQLEIDQTEPSAGCEKEITRFWSIIDWCTPQGTVITIDTQRIQLVDTIAPTFIDCSKNSDISLAEQIDLPANSCEITLDFPLPTAIDNCDAKPIVKEFTVQELVNGEWSIKAASLFQTSLEAGTYRVGYEAQDNCMQQINADTCYRYFVVADTIVPVAVCNPNIMISLDGDAGGILTAEEVDGGSRDECGIAQILIQRSDCLTGDMRQEVVNDTSEIDLTEWFPSVDFECCDANRTVVIGLLVIDKSGNYNICSTTTRPTDELLPICTALAAATGSCTDYETVDFGRPTDVNDNGEFDEEEWLDLFPNQIDFFNENFGNPSDACSDNITCNDLRIEQAYQLLESKCGGIQVKRRYRAIDISGNTTPWLEQIITIEYQPDWVITLPADELTNCAVDKIEVPVSPIQNGACDQLVWSFRDEVVGFGANGISEIIRTFNIVNECLIEQMDDQWLEIPRVEDEQGIVRSPSILVGSDYPLEDHFSYIQKIRFVDEEAPFLVLGAVDTLLFGKGDAEPFGEEDQTPGIFPYECDDVREFTIFARDCNEPSTERLSYSWEFLSDGEVVATGDGDAFLQPVLPNIPYTVNWMVNDVFGNQSDTSATYEFVDAALPTPICVKDYKIEIDVTARVATVSIDSINGGSFDNCSDQTNVELFLWHPFLRVDTPQTTADVRTLPGEMIFTCADVGETTISLYAIDEAGNYNFCSTVIEILDSPVVDCNETMLGGTITDRFGAPIMDATIEVIGADSIMTMVSNRAGNYDVMLPAYSNYTVRSVNKKYPLNGVSTYDLILLTQHIIGAKVFTSPYQYLAADVNRSGTVSAYDMVQMRQLILNQISEFPNNDSWRFINAKEVLPAGNPLTSPIQEQHQIDALAAANVYVDFVGVKVGDISGDAISLANLQESQTREARELFILQTNNQRVEKGETYTVPIYAQHLSHISGFQFTLRLHDLILTNIIGGIVTTDELYLSSKGREQTLTTSWHSLESHENNNSSPLFSLTFESTTDGQLLELLQITSDPTPAEAYSFSGDQLEVALIPEVTKATKDLNFGISTAPPPSTTREAIPTLTSSEGGDFTLFQNTPNPFQHTTTIALQLPSTALTALSIFNIHGQNILQTQQTLTKGTHQIKLILGELPKGTYFYRLATPFGVATKKMIVVE